MWVCDPLLVNAQMLEMGSPQQTSLYFSNQSRVGRPRGVRYRQHSMNIISRHNTINMWGLVNCINTGSINKDFISFNCWEKIMSAYGGRCVYCNDRCSCWNFTIQEHFKEIRAILYKMKNGIVCWRVRVCAWQRQWRLSVGGRSHHRMQYSSTYEQASTGIAVRVMLLEAREEVARNVVLCVPHRQSLNNVHTTDRRKEIHAFSCATPDFVYIAFPSAVNALLYICKAWVVLECLTITWPLLKYFHASWFLQ